MCVLYRLGYGGLGEGREGRREGGRERGRERGHTLQEVKLTGSGSEAHEVEAPRWPPVAPPLGLVAGGEALHHAALPSSVKTQDEDLTFPTAPLRLLHTHTHTHSHTHKCTHTHSHIYTHIHTHSFCQHKKQFCPLGITLGYKG